MESGINGSLKGDMKKTNSVLPRLSVMNPEQIKQVHEYSLRILSSIGLRVDSLEARKRFAFTIAKAHRHFVCRIRRVSAWA
jgi:trimethylamine:corrinoid methyltransferase-like protein